MDQLLLTAVCRILIGHNGRRLGHPDIKTAYLCLFSDYYQYNAPLGIKTYYKYSSATTPFPHFLQHHYGPQDYHRTLGDMMNLVDACTSITLLRQIQSDLYRWVTTHLPPDEAASVNSNYVSQDAVRRQLAIYLADVLHHAINKEIGENRPTATDNPS